MCVAERSRDAGVVRDEGWRGTAVTNSLKSPEMGTETDIQLNENTKCSGLIRLCWYTEPTDSCWKSTVNKNDAVNKNGAVNRNDVSHLWCVMDAWTCRIAQGSIKKAYN